jgi:hypothetical protein
MVFAPQRVHILAAAVLWSLVGTGLLLAGVHWLRSAESAYILPAAIIGIAVGYAKARFVLDRTAARIIRRIEQRGDNRCIFGFQSWGSWAMVIGFMVLGRVLRASPLPVVVLGAIYLAVGSALFLSSITLWIHWSRQRSS